MICSVGAGEKAARKMQRGRGLVKLALKCDTHGRDRLEWQEPKENREKGKCGFFLLLDRLWGLLGVLLALGKYLKKGTDCF